MNSSGYFVYSFLGLFALLKALLGLAPYLPLVTHLGYANNPDNFFSTPCEVQLFCLLLPTLPHHYRAKLDPPPARGRTRSAVSAAAQPPGAVCAVVETLIEAGATPAELSPLKKVAPLGPETRVLECDGGAETQNLPEPASKPYPSAGSLGGRREVL